MNFTYSVRDYIIQWSITIGGACVLMIWGFIMMYQERRKRRKDGHGAHDTTPPSGVR